jgi:hypothetical protein
LRNPRRAPTGVGADNDANQPAPYISFAQNTIQSSPLRVVTPNPRQDQRLSCRYREATDRLWTACEGRSEVDRSRNPEIHKAEISHAGLGLETDNFS